MNRYLSLTLNATVVLLAAQVAIPAAEFHVAVNGGDANPGTSEAPLRTIQRAADLALPGDTITVHAGVYRERVNPPRGGTSDRKRIIYRAELGDEVEIKGSEVITNWVKAQEDVWKVTLPNGFFGGFNPYSDLLRGDWFKSRGRKHHTGAVYLDGEWLTEAAKLEDVLRPGGTNALWFGQVDATQTTIWAQFKGVNPNDRLVEINARQTVFYPDQPGRDYITVRGFTMRHAATPWAPPTAEQKGLIGTHWSRGWVIEHNTISHSVCCGIALGKYGDEWDNTSSNSAKGYVLTIQRGLTNGWQREMIGHHVVRNNTISHCEQAGIVGSLGAAFTTVTGNTIHDIHVRRLFSGAEMAGIKFHGAIDTVIRGNHIYRTILGLWLDWMAQGTRVTANLFHDNDGRDMFVEVDHGPFVVDNNLFLSPINMLDVSEGGAYAHNLFLGEIVTKPEPRRETPYHRAHSTAVAGLATTKSGDDRFYNNIWVAAGAGVSTNAAAFGLSAYDTREYRLRTGGNVFYSGARPYVGETNAVVLAGCDPAVRLESQGDQVILHLTLGPDLKQAATVAVSTALLGNARVSGLPYENADSSALSIGTDYFGKKRSKTNPSAGPFEDPGTGPLTLKVW